MPSSLNTAPRKILVASVLAIVSWRTQLPYGLNIGDVAAIALLPMTWRASRNSRALGTVVLCSLTAVAAGLALALAAVGEFVLVPSGALTMLLAAAAVPAGAAVIIWAERELGLDLAAACFMLGLLVDAYLRAESVDNSWKFAYGLPTSVLILALAHRMGRTAEILSALLLAILYLRADSRSAIGFLLVTVAILSWQAMTAWARVHLSPRAAFKTQLSMLTALAVFAIGAVLAASSSGLLGEAAQTRTTAQSTGVNILAAARPEMGATFALFEHRPWGYGAGVAPRYSDIRVAMEGMRSLGYDPDNGYVVRYMFGGGHFELHSAIADLWAALSLPGLALGIAVVLLSLTALGRTLATLRSRAWVVFITIVVAWNCLFGPLSTIVAYMELVVAAAVCLPPVFRRDAANNTAPSRR
ncbi:hypothetical protein [Actinomyces qiguomingii]|uniref:hypothetical protein n=1 Tax=Actinomyces qiguomingii TaxID=2057800 RepID=UPI000FFE67C3|nr:hypothetical protein [Actinomyces qiguomingii]